MLVTELKTLTMKGKTYDSFPDKEAREKILEMEEEIPTDDHINELISTALGVIENGTY